jgi:hypothetical protein
MTAFRNRHRRRALWPPVMLAAWAAVVRGDDVVVEESPAPRRGVPMAMEAPAVDLLGIFDAQAFRYSMRMEVVEVDADAGGPQPAGEDELVQRLEPVQRRAAARIATVERIAGLSAAQRKKLEIAAQSDLRRLFDTVAEARAKYAGRKLKMDPRNGGFGAAAQEELQQAQQDGQRCRQSIQAAAGPESLLAKVTMSTLDEKQAERYAAVMRARAACRWKAVVAAGLFQVDDQAGFTQKQYESITALLLADIPPREAEFEDPTVAVPAGMRVAQRLVALGDEQLAAILDPRQRQVVALFAAQEKVMDEGGMAVEGVGLGGGVF